MKSKLLEFEKSLEDEVCSRVLIFLHKTIDENFPDAPKVASKRFSQTVVAHYDKLKTEDNLEKNDESIPSVKDENVLQNMDRSNSSNRKIQEQNTSNDVFSSKEVSSNNKSIDTDPFGSASNVDEKSSQYSGTFESKKGFQEFAESDFNSESSKIFSDKYLNKIARKSKRGFIYRFVRFILILLILVVAIVFITGKQDQFMLMIKDFPTFYEKYLDPKIKDFESYFKSDEKEQKEDILDLLNNKK